MTTERTVSPAVGLTQDAGWEIGVSRTVDVPLQRVWDYLTSPDGVRRWLGSGLELPAEKGTRFRTDDGTHGEVRSYHPTGRLRLTWQPAGWDHSSTVQVTVSDRSGRTSVRFHQEKLADADERSRQREHWIAVMDAVVGDLTDGPGSTDRPPGTAPGPSQTTSRRARWRRSTRSGRSA